MKVLKPTAVTSAMLVSSSVAETDYAAWNAATSYVIGDRVIRTTTHKIYEALQAGVDATLPENATTGTTPRWLEISATNRWKMFDDVVDYKTAGSSPLSVVLTPGTINSVAMVGLVNVNEIRVQLHDGATSVYDQTQTLDGTIIEDWYDYFFAPYDTGAEALFTNIPPYATGQLTVEFTSATTPEIGGLLVGTMIDLGETLAGATSGIISYSRKEANAFGNMTLIKRRNSKRVSVKLMLDNARLRRVQNVLADLDATPAVWVGAEDTVKFSPVVVYGFYRDFSLDIAYADRSYCNLEIEGLV